MTSTRCSVMLRGMGNRKSGKAITIVGAGSLAQALATLLPEAGYRVDEIVTRRNSRRKDSARKLARKVDAQLVTVESASWSDIVWLAVSDGAIADTAKSLASLTDWKGKVVLHSSGALSSKELAPLRRRGAYVASAHPMMTFVPGAVPKMSGVVWTLEGDSRAVSAVRQVLKRLGGKAVPIDPKYKPLYHAFGAFLSPLLVTYLDAASQLALASGISRRDVAALMRPIVEQTLQNLFANVQVESGSGKAFSGPLIRGDVSTIESHMRALKRTPNVRNLYAALVSTALRSGLPVKNKAAISRAISREK